MDKEMMSKINEVLKTNGRQELKMEDMDQVVGGISLFGKILKTEDSGRKITKKIKKGMDKNTIYEEIYKKNVNKMEDPYGMEDKSKNTNNISNITGFIEQDSIYNQPIEYGKAIDILHNALYSIDLEPDQGDGDY